MKQFITATLLMLLTLGITIWYLYMHHADFILYLAENDVSNWLIFIAFIAPLPTAFAFVLLVTFYLTKDYTSRRMYEK